MQQPEWLGNIETEERNLIVHKISALLWRYGSLKPQMITDVEENHGLSQQQVIELGQFLTSRMHQQPQPPSQRDGMSPPAQNERDHMMSSLQQQQQRFQGNSNGFHAGSGRMPGQMTMEGPNGSGPPPNGFPNSSFGFPMPPMGMNGNGMPPNGHGHMQHHPSQKSQQSSFMPVYGGHGPSSLSSSSKGLPSSVTSALPSSVLSSAPSSSSSSGPAPVAVAASSVMVNGEIDHPATHGLTGSAAMNALQAYFRNLESTPVEEPTASSGLRKGKWTLEEEEYTWRLVQHFNVGLLPIPEGTTLRSFLSSRLQCDRMRITKKFRGVCFGRKYQPCERNHANLIALVAAEKELSILQVFFFCFCFFFFNIYIYLYSSKIITRRPISNTFCQGSFCNA
jgi:hypothetical protein